MTERAVQQSCVSMVSMLPITSLWCGVCLKACTIVTYILIKFTGRPMVMPLIHACGLGLSQMYRSLGQKVCCACMKRKSWLKSPMPMPSHSKLSWFVLLSSLLPMPSDGQPAPCQSRNFTIPSITLVALVHEGISSTSCGLIDKIQNLWSCLPHNSDAMLGLREICEHPWVLRLMSLWRL